MRRILNFNRSIFTYGEINLNKEQRLDRCLIDHAILVSEAEIKVPPHKHELRILNPYNVDAPHHIFWRVRGIMADGTTVADVWEQIA